MFFETDFGESPDCLVDCFDVVTALADLCNCSLLGLSQCTLVLGEQGHGPEQNNQEQRSEDGKEIHVDPRIDVDRKSVCCETDYIDV
jgi:hypothetical protein